MDSNGDVFINCPFDQDYNPLFDAILFTVYCCSYRPRCAYEAGSEDRLQRICEIIEDCEYGIHDLSRTQLNEQGLPRFNMPLELGIFIGAKQYGGHHQKQKHFLILDTEKYRFHEFISDLGGLDPKEHANSPDQVILKVRSWLKQHTTEKLLGPTTIQSHYKEYLSDRDDLLSDRGLTSKDAVYSDITSIMEGWIEFFLS